MNTIIRFPGSRKNLFMLLLLGSCQIVSAAVNLGNMDQDYWNQLRNTESLRIKDFFEAYLHKNKQYTAEEALRIIVTAYDQKAGTDKKGREFGTNINDWPGSIDHFVRIRRSELPILQDMTFRARNMVVIAMAMGGEILQVLEEKHLMTKLPNPFDPGPFDFGKWIRVRSVDGVEGWIYADIAFVDMLKRSDAETPIILETDTSSSAPPIPYEDPGACPFECCTYRRWIAKKDTMLRLNREENSPKLFNVNRGEWVSALTGVVITTVPGKATVLNPITINGIPAKNGDIVYLLTYEGEGVYETWYMGKKWELNEGNLEFMRLPESIWWVQVKNDKDQVGWSKEPDNFDNKDACGMEIEEPPVHLEQCQPSNERSIKTRG